VKKRDFLKCLVTACAVGAISQRARADDFLTLDKAQSTLFPGEKLTAVPITLTADQQKQIQLLSGVRVRSETVNAWKSGNGGWLIVDNVIGKHEFIDFALALTPKGSVKGVEIMSYRETYGREVMNPKWRALFTGKTSGDPVQIDKDIKNISGATLSSVHITDGVRRLLRTWEVALRGK